MHIKFLMHELITINFLISVPISNFFLLEILFYSSQLYFIQFLFNILIIMESLGGKYRHQEKYFFDELYHDLQYGKLWIRLNKEQTQCKLLYSGRLYTQIESTKDWQSYHFELYFDKLVRY